MIAMVSTAHAQPSPPLTGEWGGPQVRLVLKDNGGTLELACASAHLGTPIRPDATGKFVADGTYESFSGGPVLADIPPKITAARFSGHIEGNTMHLSVWPSGEKTAQDYTLERGRRVKLIRCA
jgi:hypothetical protein